MTGRTIGKYRIIGQLGRGGMGTVYKAVDRTLEREVAIKVLNPGLADTQVIRRFRQEAVTLAKLNHPEIATIHELLKSDADLLMVMELVRGETLDSICARLAPLAPDHAVYVTDRILSALGYAHNAGIVHCDMKPANVMVTGQGSVKIMDFGIAHVRGADQATPDGTGAQMIGTPAYMAPEQALGKDIDARSDLYSVGIILYRLLTGRVPFNAPTAIGMMQQQLYHEPTPPHVHREGLPAWCEPLLQRAMAKSQAERFQTAEEFRDMLQEAAGHPESAAGQAFFSSVVDLGDPGPSETPRTSVLEGIGLTRGFTHLGGLGATTISPIGSTPGASVPATIVLPARRVLTRAVLVALSVGVMALAGLAGWWRYTTNVAPPPGIVPPPVPNAPTASINAPAFPLAPPAAVSPERSAAAPLATPAAARPAAMVETPAGTRVDVPSAARPKNTPPYVFLATALMNRDDRPRVLETQVLLSDGMINVRAKDDDRLLYSVPLDSIESIAYSNGRDPLWKGPAGPAKVARGPTGFGVFGGKRHWVSLRTGDPKTPFVVLRLGDDERARSVIAALEQRTGRTTALLADDDK